MGNCSACFSGLQRQPARKQARLPGGSKWQGRTTLPAVYIYNGQRYSSLEDVRAAMAGLPTVSHWQLAEQLSNTSEVERIIANLFAQYSGQDRLLQLDEMKGLATSVAAAMNIDVAAFGDLGETFVCFDASGDGSLDLAEATRMVKAALEKHKLILGRANPNWSVGDTGEYLSPSHKRWLPCRVLKVMNDGTLEIDIKRGMYISRATQAMRLRRRGLPAVHQSDMPLSLFQTPYLQPTAEKHAVIVWNDYNWQPLVAERWGPLDTQKGARFFRGLAESSGVRDIVEISRRQCTPDGIRNAIFQVGSRCGPQDVFIFYYSGHGETVEDQDGDEADGRDEAICTVDAAGRCSKSTWLRDDDFSLYLVSYVRAATVVVLMDCCHSGTMADFGRPHWLENDKKGVSISGCRDAGVSYGTGDGGVFTHAMCRAAQNLARKGQGQMHSMAVFYNQLLQDAMPLKAQHGSKQQIVLDSADSSHLHSIIWPLVPMQRPVLASR